MDKRTDINNTSFAYSVNLLKMLLANSSPRMNTKESLRSVPNITVLI